MKLHFFAKKKKEKKEIDFPCLTDGKALRAITFHGLGALVRLNFTQPESAVEAPKNTTDFKGVVAFLDIGIEHIEI